MGKRRLLSENEHVIAAWAEPAAGPGWSNTPVWVLIRDGNGQHRVGCLQPEEQTSDMRLLYSFSALAHREMTRAVERNIKSKKAVKRG